MAAAFQAFIVALMLGATPLFAQDVANNVNPEAIEFDSPVLFAAGIELYRVEIFVAGADPAVDSPVKSFEIPQSTLDNGKVRVPLTEVLLDVPNGRYMATIRGIGDVSTAVSAPSDPFVWSQLGGPIDRVEESRRERFWTKIGLLIGGTLLLLPFVF